MSRGQLLELEPPSISILSKEGWMLWWDTKARPTEIFNVISPSSSKTACKAYDQPVLKLPSQKILIVLFVTRIYIAMSRAHLLKFVFTKIRYTSRLVIFLVCLSYASLYSPCQGVVNTKQGIALENILYRNFSFEQSVISQTMCQRL